MVGFTHVNEIKYPEIDSDGNLIDPITYEPLDKEYCMEINGRFYSREVVLELMNSTQKDPFNPNENLTHLIPITKKINIKNNNKSIIYLFIGLIILLLFILVPIITILILEFKNNNKKTNDYALNFIIFIWYVIIFIISFSLIMYSIVYYNYLYFVSSMLICFIMLIFLDFLFKSFKT